MAVGQGRKAEVKPGANSKPMSQDGGRFRALVASIHSHRHAIAVDAASGMVASGSSEGSIMAWPRQAQVAPGENQRPEPLTGESECKDGDRPAPPRWSTFEHLPRQKGHRDVVWDLVFVTPCPTRGEEVGTMLASASADKTIKIWVCSTAETPKALDVADGSQNVGGAAGGSRGEQKRYDEAGGGHAKSRWRLEQSLLDESNRALTASNTSHADDVTCLAYRPGSAGHVVATGGVIPLPVDSSSSNDGYSTMIPLLVSGSDDGVVKIWAWNDAKIGGGGAGGSRVSERGAGSMAVAHGNEFHGSWMIGCSLHGHAGRISSVALSRQGRMLVSADHGGNVLVWGEDSNGCNWREARRPGRLTGWTLLSRIRHESPVLSMTVGECLLDSRVAGCLRGMDADVWDAQEARGASMPEQARAVGEAVKAKADVARAVHQVVDKMRVSAAKRADAGMRDVTERGEVLEWLRGLELSDTQLMWKALMEKKVWTWNSVEAMSRSDVEAVCKDLIDSAGDAQRLWRAIGVLKASRESSTAMDAGYALAHALATIADAPDLDALRPDKKLKKKKRGFVWDGFQWRDQPAKVDEWVGFFARYFSRLEARGREAIEQIAPVSERRKIRGNLASMHSSLCSTIASSVKHSKTLDLQSRLEQMVHKLIDEEARLITIMANKLKKIRDQAVMAHEYADKVYTLGFSHIAVSCEELEIVPGMRVKIKPASANMPPESAKVVQVLGGGKLQVVMGEGKSKGKDSFEERLLSSSQVIMAKGVEIWQFLPLAEGDAKRMSHGVGDKELAFRRGDKMVMKREAVEEGWVWAEKKGMRGQGEGLVRQVDLRMTPHTSEGVFDWRRTHTLLFDEQVTSMRHFGDGGSFLVAASGKHVCVMLRSPCGFQGYIDQDTCPLHSSHNVLGCTARSPGEWSCVDMLEGHGFSMVHSLCAADIAKTVTQGSDSKMETAVLVSGGKDRKAVVWDMSKWATGLRARGLMEAWLRASLLKRVRKEAERQLQRMIDGKSQDDRDLILLDERRAKRIRRELRRQVSALEEEGSEVFGHVEMLEEARRRLDDAEEELERYWEEKERLMDVTEDAVWGKGIDVEQETIDDAIEKMVRQYALERRLENGEWLEENGNKEEEEEAKEKKDAAAELEWLRRPPVLTAHGGAGTTVASLRDDLEMVFHMLDSDGSGDLDVKEVQDHIASLGLGKVLHSEATRMMMLADADGDCFVTKASVDESGEVVKGADVRVEMVENVDRGKDGTIMNKGRRPHRIILKSPEPGQDALLWERSSELESNDPRHPQYLEKLVALMGSSNPKAWAKSTGSGTVDLEEFTSMFISREDRDGEMHGGANAPGAGHSHSGPKTKQDQHAIALSQTSKSSLLGGDGRESLENRLHQHKQIGSILDGEINENKENYPMDPAGPGESERQESKTGGSPIMKAMALWDVEHDKRLAPLEMLLLQVRDGSCGTSLKLDAIHMGKSSLGKYADRADWLSGLSDSLQANKSITSLHLMRMNLNNEEIREVLSSVRSTRLKSVNLSGNGDMGAAGCEAACKELSECVMMESLDLSGCDVADEGAEAIARLLLGKPNLQNLVLRNCGITDQGATAIAKALARGSRLSALDLTGNSIGDDGCRALQHCLLDCDTVENRVSAPNTTVVSVLLELNKVSLGEKAKLYKLTSDHGIQLRKSLDPIFDPVTSFARYLHALVPPDDAKIVRLIAGGVNTLDPFPTTMPLEELESALRFVSDPEDAALLLRWFRSPIAKSEMGEARVETSKSGGTPDVPGDADGDVVSHASKGAVAHSGKGAVEQQVDDGISAVEKRKAPTLFSQRPGAPRAHGARREREMALAEESRWAADSENRAAAIFATKAPWGRLVPWSQASPGNGQGEAVLLGKRRWVQEDVRGMSVEGFMRHAKLEKNQLVELGCAGLDGSAVRGGHGWVDVRLIAYDAGKKASGVGAVCWLRALHEEEGFVQGPVRSCEADAAGVWKERFRFGIGKDKAPNKILFDVCESGGYARTYCTEVSLTWYNMDRAEGQGPDAPHVSFDDRAVRVEARTARDIERWFDLGSGRRLSLQLCYRSDTSLPLEWKVDEASSLQPLSHGRSIAHSVSFVANMSPIKSDAQFHGQPGHSTDVGSHPAFDTVVTSSRHWDMVKLSKSTRTIVTERISRILGEVAKNKARMLSPLTMRMNGSKLSCPSLATSSSAAIAGVGSGQQPSGGHGVRSGLLAPEQGGLAPAGRDGGRLKIIMSGEERWHQSQWGLDIAAVLDDKMDSWHPPLSW